MLFAAAGLVAGTELMCRWWASPVWTSRSSRSMADLLQLADSLLGQMRAVTETNLASALQVDRRLDDAIDHYRRAIAIAPDFPPAYNNLGSGTAPPGPGRGRDFDLSAGASIPPGVSRRRNTTSPTPCSMPASQPRAMEHFQIALRTLPASVDVHNNLGIALMNQGRRDDAIAEFRAALALNPDSVRPT